MRAWVALAILLAPAVAGCAGSGNKPKQTAPPIEQGLSWANGFMHRLAVVGRWQGVQNDINPMFEKELRQFQTAARRDGVRRVLGPGTIRRDCVPSPTVGAGKTCIVYHLRGLQVRPISGQVIHVNGTFTLWLDWLGGDQWRVLIYDYTAKIS